MNGRKPSVWYWLTAATIGLLIAAGLSLVTRGRHQMPHPGLLRKGRRGWREANIREAERLSVKLLARLLHARAGNAAGSRADQIGR